MYTKKLNSDDVFNYIKLGTDIAKITIGASCEEDVTGNEDYCNLINMCNERLKHMEIDCKVDNLDFLALLDEIGTGKITKQFKEPFLDKKKVLFDIGFSFMLLCLIELNGETEELNNHILYEKFKNFLNKLKIPTYELLELLFDKQIDVDLRMMTFTYKLCEYFEEERDDESDDNITKSSIVAIGSNVISGSNSIILDHAIIGHKNTVSIDDTEKMVFSILESQIKNQIENSEKILQILSQMKEDVGKKSYNNKYTKFVSAMADHTTILLPFLQFLSHFLK